MPELVDTQCLREYVSNLEVRTDVVKINFPGLNAFTDEVVVHFNVFSLSVKHRVASEVDAAHIVVEDADRIHDGNAQVLQNSLEPYSFASGNCSAPVFGFRA